MSIQELIALANYLDEQGQTKEAADIDNIIKKMSGNYSPASPGWGKFEDEESPDFVPAQPDPNLAEELTPEEQFGSAVQGLGQDYSDIDSDAIEAINRVESKLMSLKSDLHGLSKYLPKDLNLSDLNDVLDRALVSFDEYMSKKQASGRPLFEKLANIADKLDSIDAHEEATLIDKFIAKHARYGGEQEDKEYCDGCDRVMEKCKCEGMGDISDEMNELAKEWESLQDKMHQAGMKVILMKEADGIYDVVDWKEEGDTAQSKRYDTKYHHSVQIREPKKQDDLEGYDDTHHVKTYDPVKKEAASMRYCPDHIGVMMGRVGEGIYQCPLDGNTYNWEEGYTDYDGKHHAGGSVAAQTPDVSDVDIPHRMFDSRENTLNRNS